LIEAQQPLDRAATSIYKLVSEAALEDFTGVAIDARTRTLTLYWHGAVPASVTDLLRQLSQTMNVRAVQAPYSFRTLDAEQRRLMSIGTDATGPLVIMTGMLPDFSGLMLQVDRRRSATVTAAIATPLRSSVKTVIETGFPMTPLE
jgi:hypothetical protein